MKARLRAGLNKTAQIAFNDEVNRQLAEKSKDWYTNIDSLILYVLHEEFGFGKDRLQRFVNRLVETNGELVDYYVMDDADFICKTKLKRIGIDVDELNNIARKESNNERPEEN